MELAQDFMGMGITNTHSKFNTEQWEQIKFIMVSKPVPPVRNWIISVEIVWADFFFLKETKKGKLCIKYLVPKRHIQSWSQASYLKIQMSYLMIPVQVQSLFFPTQQKSKYLKQQQQKKRRIIWNEITLVVPKTLLSSQHSFQSSITFTSRYTCPFQHQGFVTLFLCLKSSPFPCHQPFKQCSMWPPTCNFHQQPRESLSSLQICNNHHTDILPEFLPTFFPCDGAYS